MLLRIESTGECTHYKQVKVVCYYIEKESWQLQSQNHHGCHIVKLSVCHWSQYWVKYLNKCSAVARCFPSILDVMIFENINLSEDRIGRPPFRYNDTELDFCHQSVMYAVRSVYFNHTLISYMYVTVCHLSPYLPKVWAFDSHFLKDARKLFTWDGWIFCPYEIYQKVHLYRL
jgi:hypothetical protein